MFSLHLEYILSYLWDSLSVMPLQYLGAIAQDLRGNFGPAKLVETGFWPLASLIFSTAQC